MRNQALEHCILGAAVLCALVWFDVISTAVLRDVVVVLLAWAAVSTVLVASAGAWVAYARARADTQSHPPRHHLTTHHQ